ncbi:hypothetical protein [Halomonas sp. E14]|uniref:hypothetical protein n=1 Tax=Halomonas sp. E14 TaxID=3397245 RepID=UPI00403E4955
MHATTPMRHQRLKLLALLAIFALPMISAWVMVQWRIGIPEQRTAHGELGPDAPQLEHWPLAGTPVRIEEGDWILAFDCSQECGAMADRWWRLHRALGREAPRLSRLRIGGDAAALPGEAVAQWRSLPAWHAPGQIWVLDPQGRAVLTYGAEVEPRAVLDDINHLLRRNPDTRITPLREISQR